MLPFSYYAVPAVLLTVVYFALLRRNPRAPPKGLRQVPGPRPLPIVGNLHQFSSNPQRQLEAWMVEFGEIYKLRLGWEEWVFVSSPAAVKEILDKQAAITSARMPSPIVSDLVSGGMRFLHMDNTPRWRQLRTIVHKLLTPKASSLFKPSQEFEAKQLLYDILTANEDEESFYMHIRRYTTSVVMTSTYGRRIPHWDCDEVREIYAIMNDFTEHAQPGAYLAETFPPLSKLPTWLQWWRKRALAAQARQTTTWMKFFNALKNEMEKGLAPECFVKQMIESDFDKEGVSDVQGAYVAGTMIEAGSETTSSSLNSIVKYLAAAPDTQTKIRQEVDKVIGQKRSPTFGDEESLPHVCAAIKEVLRIRPVTKIGIPRYSTADVVYKDMFIPANTVLSLNTPALHFDETRYEDRYSFKPERYLEHPLKAGAYAAHPDPYARDHFDFGAGRRICPGMHLAENSLFVTIAKLVWAFEILPPSDGSGVDLSDDSYLDGVNVVPKPFKARFRVRSEEIEATLRAEWTKAENEGFYLGTRKVDKDGIVVT